jgi:hypothetical protein
VDDPARRLPLGAFDRAVLRPVLVRLGLRGGVRQLPHADVRERRSVARPRQGLLAHGLDPRLLRHPTRTRG